LTRFIHAVSAVFLGSETQLATAISTPAANLAIVEQNAVMIPTDGELHDLSLSEIRQSKGHFDIVCECTSVSIVTKPQLSKGIAAPADHATCRRQCAGVVPPGRDLRNRVTVSQRNRGQGLTHQQRVISAADIIA
tara:strand:- start:86 stop:490 length:405 start_codon:yes stop_codon:yes gene_type:complete